jgi:hypothetical protein
MRSVIIFCLLCLLVSCNKTKTETIPGSLVSDSIIPRDEMIQVLTDVHLIEASLVLQRNRGENIPLLTQKYYQWLNRKYHMSQRRFRDNLNYYKMNPENFSKLYEEVVINLTNQTKLPQNQQKKPTPSR